MKFNWKVALISFSPYVPLIIIYFLIHLYIVNDVIALFVAFGIFSVLYIFVHYRYAKPFFKKHPELDVQNLEFNPVANIVFALWVVIMVALVLLNLYPQSPEGYILVFAIYWYLPYFIPSLADSNHTGELQNDI